MRRVFDNNINPAPWRGHRLQQQYDRVDREEQIKALIKYIGQNETILDIGVGGGIEVKSLRAYGFNNSITICDYWQKSVDFVKSKSLNIEEGFVCDIVKGIERGDKSYDIVMGLELIEHLEDPKQAIQEMIRLARKKVIVTCPYKNTFRHRQHHWSIDENDIASFSDLKSEIEVLSLRRSKTIIAVYYI